MNINDVELINSSAKTKEKLASKSPKIFLLRGIMAGFYLVVAIILSYTIGALTKSISQELSSILTASTFSIALALICFLGGELFTGNNLIMGISYYDKSVRFKSVIKIWGLTYLGNLIGSIILSFIFIKSGSGKEILPDYFTGIVSVKTSISTIELLLKGILCNFIVCTAVLCNIKMKSEVGKMIAMFWLVFTFVIAGFEHSIANMGIFSMAYFLLGELPWLGVINNMVWVTIGNIIGGAILYSGMLYLMKTE